MGLCFIPAGGHDDAEIPRKSTGERERPEDAGWMAGQEPPGSSVVRHAGSFGRIFGETPPLHSRADHLDSALPW